MASKRKTKKAAKKAEACRIVQFPGGRTAEFCSHKAGASTQSKREASLKLADESVCSTEWTKKVKRLGTRALRKGETQAQRAARMNNLLAICTKRGKRRSRKAA